MNKYFLITIDTEGDNLWNKNKIIGTDNAKYLDRFQNLCNDFGYKPTYLTNFEMAESKVFQDFGKLNIKDNRAEIGLHIHAWNSPPAYKLTKDDFKFHPFLIEYPTEIISEKINYLTSFLEDTFEKKMISHRAGRWAFNETYAKLLIDCGYKIDCSVTPHLTWKYTLGDPSQNGGTDYTYFPESSYFVDKNDISKSGDSPLLEVPMTIIKKSQPFLDKIRNLSALNKLSENIFKKDINRVINKFNSNIMKFRPNGKNLSSLIDIIDINLNSKNDYLEFMLHSSELMPNGSPTFKSNEDIENLYEHLKIIFKKISKHYSGKTLTEYHDIFINNRSK